MSRRADAREALFAGSRRRAGTLMVDCGRCGARTRMSYVDLLRRSLPLPLWQPWRHHSRLVRCPVCEHRTWIAARWFD